MIVCKKDNTHTFEGKRCKECQNVRVKVWQKANSENVKSYKLKARYNITLDEYNQMFINQEGKCKICFKHQSELPTALCVDHCHTTDKVRGLLCKPCNLILGNANDTIEILKKAISYLEEL